MKKYIRLLGFSLWATIAISISSCNEKYDDSELRSSISALESRVNATEQILNAYKNNLFITSITQNADGYVITFSDNTQVIIVNDKPVEFPEDKYTCYIDHIDVTDTHVVFYLSDGSNFAIGIACALDIEFDLQTTELTMIPGQERTIGFTISSQIHPIEAEVLASGDVKAKILSFDPTTGSGSLSILSTGNPDSYSKVVLIAANERRVAMKRIDFSPEGIDIFDDARQPVTNDGGELELGFVSSVENVEVEIPAEAASWISVINGSRAAEYRHVRIHVEPNTGTAREADIIIRETGGIRFIVFHISQNPQPGAVYESEKEALYKVITSLNVPLLGDLSNLMSRPITEWPGVTIDDNGHVTELCIDLPASGTLDPAIGQLKYLKKLIFYAVKSLPQEIGLLKNLEYLKICGFYRSSEGITGALPEFITSLTKLSYIEIYNQNLTEINADIANLKNLETLILRGNDLRSVDFNAICKLTSLRTLDLYGNSNMTGTIPSEISNLQHLETFNVSYCELSGSIPESFWSLASLRTFGINGNRFDPIKMPASIKGMKNIETIDIGNATGSLPSDIGECSNLKTIIMDFSDLSGEIPASITRLTNLECLSLPGNKLEGPIPSGLSKMPKLKHLQLSSNNLSGTISEDYSHMDVVWLYNNNLTGRIPQAMIDNREFWRENWGKIYYQNQFDPIEVDWDGPHLVDFIDQSWTQPFHYADEYPKNEYTLIFQWSSRCAYLDECLAMVKKIHQEYGPKGVKVIGRTHNEDKEAIIRLGMTWPTYFTPQTDYPTYVVPTLSLIDRNGKLVFTDLIHDRFSLTDFIAARLNK